MDASPVHSGGTIVSGAKSNNAHSDISECALLAIEIITSARRY
jgi:hypothetical protein